MRLSDNVRQRHYYVTIYGNDMNMMNIFDINLVKEIV